MKEETKENLIKRSLDALVGVIIGTMDIVSTGHPIFTLGIPIWETFKFLDYHTNCERLLGIKPKISVSEGLKNYAKGSVPYTIGASIPFAVKYHNEMISLIYQLYDKIV